MNLPCLCAIIIITLQNCTIKSLPLRKKAMKLLLLILAIASFNVSAEDSGSSTYKDISAQYDQIHRDSMATMKMAEDYINDREERNTNKAAQEFY